jgi:hypothetical protein
MSKVDTQAHFGYAIVSSRLIEALMTSQRVAFNPPWGRGTHRKDGPTVPLPSFRKV